MDLSKAFNCLPHAHLVGKLRAYELSEEALQSYLSDRSQQVRLGTSAWENLLKGVLQGSILGPLLFIVFLKDMFYLVLNSTIYKFADDNTISYIHKDFNFKNRKVLIISWSKDNLMKVNSNKFQSICIGKKTNDKIESFRIGDTDIKYEKLLPY